MALHDLLAEIVGARNVYTDPAETKPYFTDWRRQYAAAAQCVVRPGSAEEVARVVALCAREGIAVVPQGGNTGLVGGSVPTGVRPEIVLSLARMNRIRALDVLNDTITVDAGCVLAAVQKAADDAGRLFPLSLAAEGSCQIGGNLSTNAGGVNVLRYGTAREQVLGLEVVLPDGRVWNGLRALRKDNTGYDLKQLFLGAEGTLGIITAAVLRLFPRPSATATAWIALDSPRAAVELLGLLRGRLGERLSAFELISRPASRPCSRTRRANCAIRSRAHIPGTCSRSSATAASLQHCAAVSRRRLPIAPSAARCATQRSHRASSARARCGASVKPFRKRNSATSSTTSRSRSRGSPNS